MLSHRDNTEMDAPLDDVSRIKSLLKEEPLGLNIREISEKLDLNRNSAAKLLEILTVKEEVEIRVYGRSKVYLLAQKVPPSDLMKFSSNFLITLDANLRIVQANDAFFLALKISKKTLLHTRLTDIPTELFRDPEILRAAETALMGTETCLEICVKKDGGETWYRKIFTPTRFQDQSRGVILFIENITEKKKIENALRDSEEKFRNISEKSLSGIYLIQDERFLYANKKLAEIFGYTSEEISGNLGPKDLIVPEDWPMFEESVRKRLTGEVESVHYEFKGLTKSGRVISIEIFGTVTQFHGKPAIIGTLLDITNRRQAELALEQSKNQLAEIISFLPDATFVIDREGKIIAWNRAIEEMTGVSAKDMLGKGNYEYSLPFYRERRPITIDLVFSDHEEIRDKYPFFIKKGDRSIAEIFIPHLCGGKGAFLWFIASPLYDTDGKIIGAIESIRNISYWKKAEEASRESEHKYRTLVESSFDGIVIHQKGLIVYANPAAIRMFGSTSDRMALGTPVLDFIHPDYRDVVRERMTAVAKDPQIILREKFVRKDGCIIDADVVSIPIIWNGEPAGYVIFRDITNTVKAEIALRESEGRVKKKLNALLSPDGDIGSLDLADIINVPVIRAILADFYAIAQVGVSINDLDGNILIGFGWQDICTKFHRVNPETCRYCVESDTSLCSGVAPGTFRLYKCKNQMWDQVTPIVVGGKHAGNLFSGQFFFDDEPVDYTFFRTQAKKYGFDEKEYLAALDRVPRFSRKTVETAMTFYTRFAEMVASLSYANILQARMVTDRDRLLESLKENEKKYRTILENIQDVFYRSDSEGNLIMISPSGVGMMGCSSEADLLGKNIADTYYADPVQREEFLKKLGKDGSVVNFEITLKRFDGSLVLAETNSHYYYDEKGTILGVEGIFRDISRRKAAEQALAESRRT